MITLILFPFLTAAGALLHLFLTKTPRNKKRVLELFLLYSFFIMIGLGGIWAFMGHAFLPDKIASYIGWAPGSPFQFEVAVANLAIAALGLLSIKFRDNFWTATVMAAAIFYWGAAYGHIMDMITHGNHAPGNAGAPVYFDIIFPFILIILLIVYKIGIKGK
jgi:fatty acid desaturase